jgi:hypothetical protein
LSSDESLVAGRIFLDMGHSDIGRFVVAWASNQATKTRIFCLCSTHARSCSPGDEPWVWISWTFCLMVASTSLPAC